MAGGGDAGGVNFKLEGDATSALAAIKSIVDGLGETGKKVQETGGMFSELGKTVGDVGKVFATFAVGSLVFGAAEQVKGILESVVTLGEATHKLQTEIGGTAEQVSGDLAVFERWGLSNEQAAVSLGILAKNVTTYSDESQKAQAKTTGLSGVVERLGLNFKDSSGAILPMDAILGQVADKFHAMPDGIEKTNDATVLFGRSGREI